MLILVADDDADNRALLARFLTRRGHEVVTAATGPDAFETTLARTPDLVLMDVGLPGLSGLEVARRLRADARARATPIVAVTAHAAASDRERCLAAGCDGYAAKPVDYDALDRLIASVAARRAASDRNHKLRSQPNDNA